MLQSPESGSGTEDEEYPLEEDLITDEMNITYGDKEEIISDTNGQGMTIKSQVRAVLLKNLSLHKRQRKTICCQIIFPALLIVFMGSMQYIVDDLVPGTQKEFIVPASVQLYPQSFAYTFDMFVFFHLFYILLYGHGLLTTLSDFYNRFWVVDNTPGQQAGFLTPHNERAGLLGLIDQYSFLEYQWTNITTCPFFEPKTSILAAQEEIRALIQDLNQYSAHHISNSYLLFESPDGVLGLHSADVSTGRLSFEIMYSDNLVYTRREKLRITNKIRFELNSLIHMVHSSFTKASNGSVVTASIQGFPYWNPPISFDLDDIVGPMLIPFAITFLIPVFMHTIVLEKENRVREMMKMMGMKMSTYWAINYLFDYAIYVLVTTLFIGLEYVISVRLFTETSMLLIIVILFIWGHAQVSLSFLFSSFFSNASLSSVGGYMIVVVSVTTGVALNQFLYPNPGEMPWFFYLWPIFVFDRAIYLLFASCEQYHCLTWNAMFNFHTEIPQILLVLLVQTAIILVIATYLDRVIPGTYGVPEHPLFCCLDPSKRAIPLPEADEYGWYDDEVEDIDVLSERERVNQGQMGSIVIRNLQKVYQVSTQLWKQKNKVALKGIYLSIQEDECFGLLGPNGAGKTSLISILTGLYAPSGGTAEIQGKDIRYEMDAIRTQLGICPQFDIQWDCLTPFEHVLFYSRLKGIPSSEEKEHAMSLLRQVGLEDCAHSKFASELSGGMRRRLSVSMALAGNPKVVFLDEPTSGLDPQSKRQLWDIVSSSKKGRSIILTTHSMEEADVLCDRISIIATGRLQCLGTPLHLKNKFGFGYRLFVKAKSLAASENVKEFVHSLIDGAELIESYQNHLLFQVPASFQEAKKLSHLFTEIELHKDAHAIEQWGITQTRLEDVFLSIIAPS